jgi:hypothetical protein
MNDLKGMYLNDWEARQGEAGERTIRFEAYNIRSSIRFEAYNIILIKTLQSDDNIALGQR